MATKKRTAPAIAKLDAYGIENVCANLIEGKTLTGIAKLAKVSIGSLLTWLDQQPERSARAREARIQAAKVWDERALEGIEKAKDPFQLAKAKEAAHHLRWRAAKIAPRDYGDKLGLGQAADLPPLPVPAGAEVTVTNNFELPPGEAYAQMLTRKRA